MVLKGQRSMSMKVIKATDSVGAFIEGVDLSKPLSDQVVLQVLEALYQNLVVVFRGQKISFDDQVRFASYFGELKKYAQDEFGETPRPEIICISNVVKGGHLSNKEVSWHSDSAFMETPPSFSFLYGVEIPTFGGDTYWANMYEALERLPSELKAQVESLQVQHDNTHNTIGEPRVYLKNVQAGKAKLTPGATHPLIATHPATGRKALYYGRVGLNQVVGMSLDESRSFLEKLESYATRPELVYRHIWKEGDFAIWDNRCTVHRRDNFDNSQRRIMYRCEAKDSSAVNNLLKKAS
jgi:taurine dioxygenase